MLPKKTSTKKYGSKRKIYRKRRLPLKMNAKRVGGPNTCRITETVLNVPILANQGYQVEVNGIMGARAQATAPQFALYRVSRVVFKFKPTSDTYVSNAAFIGGAGAVTVPNLYWKMNRFGDAPAAITSQNLRDMGAKAIRFDDKAVTISYKPNVLTGAISGGTNSGQVKMTPWLNTDSQPDQPGFALSTSTHYGHFHLIECATNGNGATPVGTVDMTIYYEFKNPRVTFASSQEAPQTVKVSTLVDAVGHVLPELDIFKQSTGPV